jgi:hypothetical protein
MFETLSEQSCTMIRDQREITEHLDSLEISLCFNNDKGGDDLVCTEEYELTADSQFI